MFSGWNNNLNVICCYAPQSGLSAEEKDIFYKRVFSVVASVPVEEILVLRGDFNGHVGEQSAGLEGVPGGTGYGLRILYFSVASKLAIINTFSRKNKSRLVTFSSGGNHTQIDLILVRRAQLKNIKDTKVVSCEECITQHKLLVCDLVVSAKLVKPIRIPLRRKTWKLKDAAVQKEFEQAVSMKCQWIPAEVKSAWEYTKNVFLEASDEICGYTRSEYPQGKETWWWSNDVNNVVNENRKTWKLWKNGVTKKVHLKAKKAAKTTVYFRKGMHRQSSLPTLTIIVTKVLFLKWLKD